MRIDLGPEGRIGLGKIELLENIALLGSISAAGRAMGMSYRRAWDLVEEINQIFGKPVATRRIGGKNGGGAVLTPLGLALIARFRAIERAVSDVAHDHIAALQNEIVRRPAHEEQATPQAPPQAKN
ncbi:winged helix-turn-helix domain-containing protein [Labrys neptuniae]|uniref:Winged helix-turn-helix domain-containing protein n=1 Tax=Labrys neptuniae TaxID=376174 RepID=A0ABV3PMX4_9HYPH|nr:winged helix-turn-helix domain-containing protein [Labrys neptuniae]MDT3381384.1 winged helix-turn-helix domain-containing protein [Labrys neptuniae]